MLNTELCCRETGKNEKKDTNPWDVEVLEWYLGIC
jgi:hypothetical protein